MHVVTHYRNERHRDYYHRFIKRRGYERIRESPQPLTLSQGSTSTEGDTATRPNKIINQQKETEITRVIMTKHVSTTVVTAAVVHPVVESVTFSRTHRCPVC